MAFTLVQAPTTIANTLSSPATLAFGSNNIAGNLLVALVFFKSPPTTNSVTDTIGNTWLQAGSYIVDTNSPTDRIGIFYVPSCKGGANTVQLNFTGGVRGILAIAEFTPGAVLDVVSAGATTTNSSTCSAGAITPAGSGELLVMVGAPPNALFTWTASTDISSLIVTNPQQVQMGYNLSAPTGTTTPAMTVTGTATFPTGLAATFRVASSNAYSVPDSRAITAITPNSSRAVQGTLIYDVPKVDSRTAGAPVDSRTAGAPTDSRATGLAPQNSRTPGTYGPGVN